MKSLADPRVDAYIGKAAPFARPILSHLRRLVRQECPEAAETLKWGMPHFVYRGSILCGMAAFKAHGAFWFWHRGMKKVLGGQRRGAEAGMGQFGRITCRADLPADATLRRYIQAAVDLADCGVPAKSRSSARRAEPHVPADLAAALRGNSKAANVFQDFSPSHRRAYVDWIEDAKRPETRTRRLATTLEWLAAGKAHNWKYARS